MVYKNHKSYNGKVILVKNNAKKHIYPLCMWLALIICELIYFRDLWFGQKILGINSDSILINLTLEHWFDVLNGKVPILTLRSFFPASGSLGYTDALIVPGVIYSLLRSLGIELFTANNLSLVLLHLLGVVLLYKVLRELGCSYTLSFIGLFFSLWSCSFTQLSYHTQFFCISTVPLFFLAVIKIYKCKENDMKKRLPWAFLATLGVGLTFLSAYYIAYFTSLIIGIALIIFWLLKPKKRFTALVKMIKGNYTEALIYLFMQLIWIVPFLIIYIPVYDQTGGFNNAFSWLHAPDIYDILRTGSYAPIEKAISSSLPSPLPDELMFLMTNRILEVSCGWAVITLILFLTALTSILISKKKDLSDHLILSISLSILLLHLLTCRYGAFFPWLYISKILPGANTVRALGRYLGICTPFLSIVICVWLKVKIPVACSKKLATEMILYLILTVIVIISNLGKRYTRDDISEIDKFLTQVSTPPADCTVFFICPMELDLSIYDINMYAWLIADRFDIRTINGYSGNIPLGWHLLEDDLKDYFKEVQAWIELNNLKDHTGLYGYITGQDIWAPYTELNISIAE